ncbi:ATP-dependent RNA helicase RhlB [Litorivivens sp.]|uniref:ATP-dependent RNA helicase RhlB n=2 Tax=Litorivivens sp. TaxID=2020868 RepID=UPI0035658562
MLKKLFSRDKTDPVATPPKTEAPEQRAENEGKGKSSERRSGNKKRRAKPAPSAWSLSDFPVPEAPGKVRFHDLGLDDTLMRAIADLGFQYCSPIQAAVLPHTLRGHDAIGKAQTGTGKTAAFLISVINDLINNPIEDERYLGEPRALVIAPTRELVQQIAEDAKGLTKYTNLNVVTLIGGMDYQKQQNQLSRDLVDIVIATPGRLLDFTGRGDLYLDGVEQLVIDEADRMLDMGFIPQVKRIIRLTPRKESRQTLLFSATFTEDIIRLTEQWTYQPVNIEIEPDNVATDNVDQRVYLVEEREKFQILQRIIRMPEAESVIVFANRRDQTRRLHERLRKSGIRCGLLSGEIAQNKRTQTLQQFKDGTIQVLVATDVAGRGIHVDGISHVVNFTLPEDPEDYVHRIGRTGRAGAKGTSISFASEDDAFLLPEIEKLLGSKLACEQPPEALR